MLCLEIIIIRHNLYNFQFKFVYLFVKYSFILIKNEIKNANEKLFNLSFEYRYETYVLIIR
jgi:hypothetical protein